MHEMSVYLVPFMRRQDLEHEILGITPSRERSAYGLSLPRFSRPFEGFVIHPPFPSQPLANALAKLSCCKTVTQKQISHPGISQSGRESSTLLCHDLEPRLAYRAKTPPAFRLTITIIRPRSAKCNKKKVKKLQPSRPKHSPVFHPPSPVALLAAACFTLAAFVFQSFPTTVSRSSPQPLIRITFSF